MSLRINSIADAVAVLDYLHKRELLCDQCGGRVATLTNTHSSRCEACKSPHAEYKKARIPNELEGNIVRALQDWTTENSPQEGGRSTGDTAPVASNG